MFDEEGIPHARFMPKAWQSTALENALYSFPDYDYI